MKGAIFVGVVVFGVVFFAVIFGLPFYSEFDKRKEVGLRVPVVIRPYQEKSRGPVERSEEEEIRIPEIAKDRYFDRRGGLGRGWIEVDGRKYNYQDGKLVEENESKAEKK